MKRFAAILSLVFAFSACVSAQDWIRTGTGLGVEKIRLAVPDFKMVTTDTGTQNLAMTFNVTFCNDLQNAGIFDMVSRSFYPFPIPGAPQEVHLSRLGRSAAQCQHAGLRQPWCHKAESLMCRAGSTTPRIRSRRRCWASSIASRPRMRTPASSPTASPTRSSSGWAAAFKASPRPSSISSARAAAPKRSGRWIMTAPIRSRFTHLGSIALSPHVSPDGTRVAFSGVTKEGWQILMYSLDLEPVGQLSRTSAATTIRPRGLRTGRTSRFSSSRTGNTEIYAVELDRRQSSPLDQHKGPDVSPTWNPKTNAQIAWVSGRTGLPQIYTMASDGTNVVRVTDQGYAVSPSWSPNGQFLAFAWVRHYGPGAPGASDIYIMDIASKQWVQLTHDGGRNDFPSWSPDGRHIVFQSNRSGKDADLDHAGRRQRTAPVDDFG